MEPTGMSWFPVAHRLADAGVAVARVKGKRVKALRRYLSEHAKTDLADAHVLAAIPGFGGPRLDLVHIPAPKSHALQRLTKQRGRMQDAVADAKRRLLDLVRWASPTLERVLPDFRTRLSLALLQRWLDPDAVLVSAPVRPSPASSPATPAAITPTAAPSSTSWSRASARPPAMRARFIAAMSTSLNSRPRSSSRSTSSSRT